MGVEICLKKEFGTHCRLKKKLFNGSWTNTFIDYISQIFQLLMGTVSLDVFKKITENIWNFISETRVAQINMKKKLWEP